MKFARNPIVFMDFERWKGDIGFASALDTHVQMKIPAKRYPVINYRRIIYVLLTRKYKISMAALSA